MLGTYWIVAATVRTAHFGTPEAAQCPVESGPMNPRMEAMQALLLDNIGIHLISARKHAVK